MPAEFQKRVSYHDSCYYGRFNDVYDEPRDVLVKAGANLQEMQRHKHFGMCCGAGGGRMWIEEDPDKRVNLLRTEQALETNPEVIAVSCPFCMTMLVGRDQGERPRGACADARRRGDRRSGRQVALRRPSSWKPTSSCPM